ncbi:MAG: DNA alkylation repair protein [Anaerolineae bacterium]
MLNLKTEKHHLLAQIQQCANPHYRAGAGIAVPTALKQYGVRIPRLRQIARDWQTAHKKIPQQELLSLVELLWKGDSHEERTLAIELLRRYPRTISRLTWGHFDRWRRALDNWSLTDALGTTIFGPWLLAAPDIRLNYLEQLIADEDVWSRRLALVATVPINRGRTGFTIPELTLTLINRVKDERHPMITKAVSWALRELTKTHRDSVAGYLEKNRDILAPHITREVSNKLRTGLKSGKAP